MEKKENTMGDDNTVEVLNTFFSNVINNLKSKDIQNATHQPIISAICFKIK